MRNKRILLALAVGVFCAFSAPSASAAEFHVGIPVTGTQSINHVFKTDSGSVTCSVVHLTGSALGTTEEMTMTPKYQNCTAFGFINTTIDVNGCGFLITADGLTHIECPAGKKLEITVPGCTTAIGSQTVSSTTFANIASNTDILMTANISEITYNECGTVKTNGTYTGSTTVTSSANIWFE